MHKFISALVLFLTLAGQTAAAPATGDPYLSPFAALYEVAVDGFTVGEMKRSLRHLEGDTYVLKSKMYTTGLAALFKEDSIVERSTWKLNEGRPKPMEYYYHHEGRGGDLVERLTFNWSEGTVTSLRDKETTTLDIIPNLLEKQVYQLVLREDLAAGKKEINYEVADRGDIRTYRFRVVGEESIETEIGELRALKVERLSHSEERKTYFWCSIEHNYQLVRLVQEDDGHIFSSDILKLET